MKKKQSRIKKAKKLRNKIRKLNGIRLVVHRTPRHMYSQIISSEGNEVLVSASTVEKEILKEIKNTGNKKAAYTVGKFIAQRAIKKGIKHVSFDRSGFAYHGRIKALADAARNFGLLF